MEMVRCDNFGLPVKFVQILPVQGRIRNRSPENIVNRDGRAVQIGAHDVPQRVNFLIRPEIGNPRRFPVITQVDTPPGFIEPVQLPEDIPACLYIVLTDNNPVGLFQNLPLLPPEPIMENQGIPGIGLLIDGTLNEQIRKINKGILCMWYNVR